MKRLIQKLNRPIKTRWLIVSIAVVLVAIVSWWAYAQYSPKPLDDKFEYLGKYDYGCWTGFCDSRPGSVYYYETDIDSRKIMSYFKEATYISDASDETFAVFTTPEGNFTVTYEDKAKAPRPTHKRYVVTLSNSAYDVAVKHLP